MSGKEYQPWAPRQAFLLPPSPLEWLPEGHLAYFVLDVVEQLDLRAIEDVIQGRDPRGQRPYSPRMMTALVLYAYCVGVFSSRKIERATYEDVAFRVLAGGTQPFFTTINQFRLDHRKALSGLFLQVLKLCRKAGLGSLGRVALDGTKVHANASKHKAMSYQRMKEDEKRLQAEIQRLMQAADAADREEDARFGAGQRPADLPAELSLREARLAKIREAKAALEREAIEARADVLRDNAEGMREKAADESVDAKQRREAATRAANSERRADELAPKRDDDDDDNDDAGLPKHRTLTTLEGEPKPEAQRNFTDPESRIMMRDGAVMQGYNGQLLVAEDQVIIATAVTNQAPDAEHLVPMLERCERNCGERPDELLADSAYLSKANVEYCEARGIDAYIAVSRKMTDAQPQGPSTAAFAVKQRMHAKLATEAGKATYSRRKVIAEPPIGQIKFAQGFRRFLLRGLEKVRREFAFVCTAHNLLKLWRAGRRAQALPV
jgi:transposase